MNGKSLSDYTPSELILARSRAFSAGDFGFIHESYHTESNFRRQFPDRDEYCRFGEKNLGPGYKILACRVLDESLDSEESRVVFLMQMDVQGDLLWFAELVWLKKEDQAWRYHRGLKMTASELPAEPETLTICDFDNLEPNTIY